jgi:hypothetical protein
MASKVTLPSKSAIAASRPGQGVIVLPQSETVSIPPIDQRRASLVTDKPLSERDH